MVTKETSNYPFLRINRVRIKRVRPVKSFSTITTPLRIYTLKSGVGEALRAESEITALKLVIITSFL